MDLITAFNHTLILVGVIALVFTLIGSLTELVSDRKPRRRPY